MRLLVLHHSKTGDPGLLSVDFATCAGRLVVSASASSGSTSALLGPSFCKNGVFLFGPFKVYGNPFKFSFGVDFATGAERLVLTVGATPGSGCSSGAADKHSLT